MSTIERKQIRQDYSSEKIGFGASALGSAGLAGCQGFRVYSNSENSVSDWLAVGALTATFAVSVFGLVKLEQRNNKENLEIKKMDKEREDLIEKLKQQKEEFEQKLSSAQSNTESTSTKSDFTTLETTLRQQNTQYKQLQSQKNEIERKLEAAQEDLKNMRAENETLREIVEESAETIQSYETQIKEFNTLVQGMSNLDASSPGAQNLNKIRDLLKTPKPPTPKKDKYLQSPAAAGSPPSRGKAKAPPSSPFTPKASAHKSILEGKREVPPVPVFKETGVLAIDVLAPEDK
jgi:hypothetical protein